MKFLHTADWQIGKPFASIEDPRKRMQVQQARIDAIKRLAALATEHQVEGILAAGDLFDSSSPDRSTVSAVCGAIGSIPVPVWAIPGNHDHGGPGGVWTQPFFQRERAALAPNLHVLLTAEPVATDTAWILPCPLLRRAEAQDTTAWLRDSELEERLGPDKPRLILAHGSVQAFGSGFAEAEDGAANHLDLDRLPPERFDYIALGDWHGTKQVAPHAWYAGTPEADRFPKGGDYEAGNVLLVEVARGQLPVVTRLRTGRLQWQEWSHSFSSDPDLAGFSQELEKRLPARVHEDLLRLHLTGPLGIEAQEQLAGHLESLRARLLDLRLVDATTVSPTEAEIEQLTAQTTNPLVARVARQLVERAHGTTPEAETARLALRELFAAAQSHS